jgi:hypothetical protein
MQTLDTRVVVLKAEVLGLSGLQLQNEVSMNHETILIVTDTHFDT